MQLDKYYPRVLILSRTAITEFNSQGAAFGNWFGGWPKERLAHLYSDPGGARDPFCGHNYLLTGRERRWGSLFDRMKQEALESTVHHGESPEVKDAAKKYNRLKEGLKQVGNAMLVDTGLWELLFPAKLSNSMDEWIRRFQPDVVFANVTDLGYMRFARIMNERYNLPLCIEIADDWPNTRYKDSVLGFAMFPLVDRTFRTLLSRSMICLTIGKEMEREYKSRYQARAEAFMCCEEPERFLAAPARRDVPPDEVCIVYCGGLLNNRWRSMLDLFRSVETLRTQGRNIGVSLYSSEVPREVKAAFSGFPWVRYFPTPPHEEVAGILKGADILFHGEAFDFQYQDYIRFSVSSKVQIYMLSGVPILVYGPAGVGVVEYARSGGWACVVDHADPTALQDAIIRLVTDASLRGQIVAKAREVFDENHDAHVVRERLRRILCQAANEEHRQNIPNRTNDEVALDV